MKTTRRCIWLVFLLVLALQAACAQAPPAKGGTKKASANAELLDLNSASLDELKRLPGVGDAYAARIVKGRPYRAKNELVQRSIVPAGVYDKFKDRVVARQK